MSDLNAPSNLEHVIRKNIELLQHIENLVKQNKVPTQSCEQIANLISSQEQSIEQLIEGINLPLHPAEPEHDTSTQQLYKVNVVNPHSKRSKQGRQAFDGQENIDLQD